MSTPIRIGTRDSALALWQAQTVERQLKALGYQTTLVPIKSTGDIVLDKPLYEMGITGIFTKTLDIAMLNGTIDIAVHSMKDVPTVLPQGIVQAAVMERASYQDILVIKGHPDFESSCTIATGSLRRKAQWLAKYPHHTVVDLRGNVNTRLQKLEHHDWAGAIFAKAGLERINVLPPQHIVLDWMIPAPSQGAMMITSLADDDFSLAACAKLNHQPTASCTAIEKDFLRTLEGGCTAPIGALAEHQENHILFKGVLFSLDGQQHIPIEKTIALDQASGFGKKCAEAILQQGGETLMKTIKAQLNS